MTDLWKNRDFGMMLLKRKQTPFNSSDYLYEIKFDGIRALIFASSKEVSVISRNKKDITYLFPELQELKKYVKGNCIFDGEIVSFEEETPSFSKLQERLHLKNENNILLISKEEPIVFVAFDIIYKDKNLVDKPLIERKKILNKFKDTDFFIKSKVFDDGIKLFKEIKKRDMEGIVAKLKNGLYHVDERTDDFIKIKNVQEGIFYVCGYILKESYVFTLILCEKKGNSFNFVGKVSVSKKEPIYKKLLECKKIESDYYEEEGAVFVSPTIKCNVEYLEKTKKGNLRHAVFKGAI